MTVPEIPTLATAVGVPSVIRNGTILTVKSGISTAKMLSVYKAIWGDTPTPTEPSVEKLRTAFSEHPESIAQLLRVAGSLEVSGQTIPAAVEVALLANLIENCEALVACAQPSTTKQTEALECLRGAVALVKEVRDRWIGANDTAKIQLRPQLDMLVEGLWECVGNIKNSFRNLFPDGSNPPATPHNVETLLTSPIGVAIMARLRQLRDLRVSGA